MEFLVYFTWPTEEPPLWCITEGPRWSSLPLVTQFPLTFAGAGSNESRRLAQVIVDLHVSSKHNQGFDQLYVVHLINNKHLSMSHETCTDIETETVQCGVGQEEACFCGLLWPRGAHGETAGSIWLINGSTNVTPRRKLLVYCFMWPQVFRLQTRGPNAPQGNRLVRSLSTPSGEQ